MCPVAHDPHDRTAFTFGRSERATPQQLAVRRHNDRRFEAEAFEKHRVRHEPQKVLQIGDTALDQVAESLRDRRARHRRRDGQIGVGNRFPTERQEGDAFSLHSARAGMSN